MNEESLPRVAVTMGDPAGIGPEICLDLLSDPGTLRACVPLVFGDASTLRRVAEATKKKFPEGVIGWDQWERDATLLDGPGVVDLPMPDGVELVAGRVDAATGAAAFRCIEAAIEAALAGKVAGVTTAPIHKVALRAAGIPFPGHTEIFAAFTGASRVCMMLTSEKITCSLVTTHTGLRDVAALLDINSVFSAIELTAVAMRRLRGRDPQLVVLGLNPHAGESGLFGAGEEERVILPAVRRAEAAGIRVTGPVPPDTAFLPGRLEKTDAFVCMYHDQGLIPLKMLAFDSAVNLTLGLPIVRTSVDHGTALDIAWKGVADPSSLCLATRMAALLGAGPTG